MNISNEKMTFLTANYGLTPEQINAFADAFQRSGLGIYLWYESGWIPDNEEACMIECLTDADRLQEYIDDYDDWCLGFLMKAELAHDLLEVSMPKHLTDYLSSQGKSSWELAG